MAGVFEVGSIKTGVLLVGGSVLMMDFCWMIFDPRGSGGFDGGQLLLGLNLTSQFLFEWESLIQAFILDKFWLGCCLP